MSNIGASQTDLKKIEDFLKNNMPGYEIERTKPNELKLIRNNEELEVFRMSRENMRDVLVGFNRGYFEKSTDQSQLLESLAGCLQGVSGQQRLQYIVVSRNSVEGPKFYPRIRHT